jgi:dTDP-3-amino-3,4,6-trideoxy-alpha-D-glucose transaminase
MPAFSVPLFDTSSQLEGLRRELDAAIARVLDSRRYILGPEVTAFERSWPLIAARGHAVAVTNGTDALTIVLRAMGVGPGKHRWRSLDDRRHQKG